MTNFVGNERKFPLKDLTGEPADDARLVREHFERVKGFCPRVEPITSGTQLSSETLPTTNDWVTIDVSNDQTVPTNAVGVECHWYATSSANTHGLWRMDSSDTFDAGINTLWPAGAGGGAGGRPVFVVGNSLYRGGQFLAFFSPGTSTFQMRWGTATPGSLTQNLIYLSWIY